MREVTQVHELFKQLSDQEPIKRIRTDNWTPTKTKFELPSWNDLKGNKSMTLTSLVPRRLSEFAVEDDVAFSHNNKPYTPLGQL